MFVQKSFDLLQAMVNLSSSNTMPPMKTFRIWHVCNPKIKLDVAMPASYIGSNPSRVAPSQLQQ